MLRSTMNVTCSSGTALLRFSIAREPRVSRYLLRSSAKASWSLTRSPLRTRFTKTSASTVICPSPSRQSHPQESGSQALPGALRLDRRVHRNAPNRADIQGQTRTSALRNSATGQWYRRANSLKRPSPTLPYGYGCIQWRRPRLPPHPAGFRPQGLYPRPGPPTLHRPWAIPSTPAKRHPDRNEECQTPGSTWPLELRRL